MQHTDTDTDADNTSYLATKNPHPRDQHIHFDEGPHKYTIKGIPGITHETEFTSVTTWVHKHFEHFDAKKIIAAMMRNQKKWNDPVANAKYYGKTAEEIEEMWVAAGREAATKGTEMHYKIECFYNTAPAPAPAPDTAPDPAPATTPEFTYFLKFNDEYKSTLKPYRTEWTVFHEEARIAGSIDMVYEVIEPNADTDAATATDTETATDAATAAAEPVVGGRNPRRNPLSSNTFSHSTKTSHQHSSHTEQNGRYFMKRRGSQGRLIWCMR